MDWGFLLSHHPRSEHHRCFRLGRVRLCARCSGVYPGMIGAALLFRGRLLRDDLPWWEDLLLLGVFPLLAVLDWGYDRVTSGRGTNLRRGVTGLLLGMGIARLVALNAAHPAHPLALTALSLMATTVLMAELLRLAR